MVWNCPNECNVSTFYVETHAIVKKDGTIIDRSGEDGTANCPECCEKATWVEESN